MHTLPLSFSNISNIVKRKMSMTSKNVSNIKLLHSDTQLKDIPTITIGIFPQTRHQIMTKINLLTSDTEKIIQFNKLINNAKPYVIIDKTSSKATIYRDGKAIKTFDIGVGKTEGDSLNTVRYNYTTRQFGEDGTTTPSGEYVTSYLPKSCYNISSYQMNGETNALLLNGVQHPTWYCQNTSLALHQLPNEEYAERLKAISSITGRKGISTGCVNFKVEDFRDMVKLLDNHTHVYILPEEKGNILELTETPDFRLWFITKYGNKAKATEFKAALKEYYNKRKVGM